MNNLNRLTAVFGMLFLAIIWGGTFAGIKFVLQTGLSVGALITIRFALGAVFMGAVMLLLKKTLDRQSLIDGTILGLILVAIFWLQVDGLRFTTASKSGFITGLSVIFTPLVSILLKEKFKFAHGLGAMVACLGLFFLVRDPSAPFGGWNRGDTETLLCAILCGFHITLTARMSRRSSPWVIALMQIVIVAVLSWILTAALPANASAGQSMAGFGTLAEALKHPAVWYVLLYLALIATTLGFFLQALFQSKVTATEAAIIFSTEPVFAAILATSGLIPLVHERLTLTQISGGALIIVAMLMSELGPKMFAKGIGNNS